MLKIHQIHVPITNTLSKKHIADKIKAPVNDIESFEIEKESLDARKNELHYSYTVFAKVKNENRYTKNRDVTIAEKERYHSPLPLHTEERPVVAGFGPSGMFAALLLAECGLRPIVIERGKCVEERTKDIKSFFTEGKLLEESNIQYGEGGAGTFSDGKLTTRIKNIRIQKVMEEFIEAGAAEEIAWQHRPHLGTDQLRDIVRNIRNKIISLGGEIHFETKLTSIIIENNTVVGVETNHSTIQTNYVLLCAGHSAYNTYQELFKQGLTMIQKDFAAGVRVEHPQELINHNQYGKYAKYLPPASYSLTHHASNGRGVYSFCMCPGGQVIPASTQQHALAVNGMSYHARDGKNANSAILVQIPAKDFDQGHPLDGFIYQKELEEKAYRENFYAPSSNIKDYLNHEISQKLTIESSYPRKTILEDMHALFSSEVNLAMSEGFQSFDKKIPGFIDQGIMVGMESRSSSPIRIPRDENGCSISIHGLYPCGEGAGYAGGIVSSAVDGIKQAENVIEHIRKK